MPMRKAWTWVGAFGPELMLCAASARVGPVRTAWWAIWVKMLGSVLSQVGEGTQSRPLTPSPAIDGCTCPDVSAM